MKAFWERANLPRGLGLWVLCIWLILVGLIPLLGWEVRHFHC